MILLAALLAVAPPDTVCATPALCELVARAAAVNRLPGNLAHYSASVESEMAVITVRPDRIDSPDAVEEFRSRVDWHRDAQFERHTIGYRSRNAALPIAPVRYLLVGTIVPLTYGDRFAVLPRNVGRDSLGARTLDSNLVYAIHPLASDRGEYYRFVRADTGDIRLHDGHTIRVIRLEVRPRSMPRERRLLFSGTVQLTLDGLHLVGLRGRLDASGPGFSVERAFGLVRKPRETFIHLENAPNADGVWLPRYQRFEFQGPRAPGGRAPALRSIVSFHDVRSVPLASTAPDAFNARAGFVLTTAPADSLRQFRGWDRDLGEASNSLDVTDFNDVRQLLGPEPTRVFVPAPRDSESVVRYNRIEGIYLGVPVTLAPGGDLTGLFVHANAGYAIWENVVRWNGSLGIDIGAAAVEVYAGRMLEVTNKFRNQFDQAALGALLARDNWDYYDRLEAGATARIGIGRRNLLAVAAGYGKDRAVERNMTRAPFVVGYLRPNRGIYEGDYFHTTLSFDVNPDVSPVFVKNGVGGRLLYEGGIGSVNFQRFEARIVARQDFNAVSLTVRAHAGITFGDSIPPQQLYELGGAVQLPGFEYKQFAGDQAALLRLRLTRGLPFLQAPLVIGNGVALPALTPSVSLGLQTAWTRISGAAAQRSVDALGIRYDDHTDQPELDPITGQPLPASVATDGFQTSIDVRAGFFNDALAVGAAQGMGPGGHFAVFVAVGRQF